VPRSEGTVHAEAYSLDDANGRLSRRLSYSPSGGEDTAKGGP
jgi:hypothetical protein